MLSKTLWLMVKVRATPHPAIVTIRGNGDYIGALLKWNCIAVMGWGDFLRVPGHPDESP